MIKSISDSSIRADLETKLEDDIRRDLIHFAKMCEVMEISNREQFASLMVVLVSFTLHLAQAGNVPKETFLNILSRRWDKVLHKQQKEMFE